MSPEAARAAIREALLNMRAEVIKISAFVKHLPTEFETARESVKSLESMLKGEQEDLLYDIEHPDNEQHVKNCTSCKKMR